MGVNIFNMETTSRIETIETRRCSLLLYSVLFTVVLVSTTCAIDCEKSLAATNELCVLHGEDTAQCSTLRLLHSRECVSHKRRLLHASTHKASHYTKAAGGSRRRGTMTLWDKDCRHSTKIVNLPTGCQCGPTNMHMNDMKDCQDKCYQRVARFWGNYGAGCNLKLEAQWRMCGNQICIRWQAWESGIAYYNLFDRAGGPSERCVPVSPNRCTPQKLIVDKFLEACDHLEKNSKCKLFGGLDVKARCHSAWGHCLTTGKNKEEVSSCELLFEGHSINTGCHTYTKEATANLGRRLFGKRAATRQQAKKCGVC